MRKDHCMCTTCLRSGWRGIWDNGRKLIKKIDTSHQWEVTKEANGDTQHHAPGKHLTPRLKRLWDYLRLQLHLHVEPTSDIGHHCLNLKLGSLAEPRFNTCCEHHDCGPPPPTVSKTSNQCSGENCADKSQHHCKHCSTSFCKTHLVENI